jgi:hypothetical protein
MRITAGLALVLLCAFAGGRASSSITVPAGGDLQGALNSAHPGDTILLAPGATYVGRFYLPAHAGDDVRPIVVRTGVTTDPVAPGQRMSPEAAAGLAKLRSPDNSPALRTENGARFWRIELVEFGANRDGAGDIITLGDGSSAQKNISTVPSDLVLDRIYVHGDPQAGQKRAIALNSARTTVSNSYISDIKTIGQDSQAIAGWNGPGDYVIQNNYLEASGENIIFGGADPSIQNLVPTQIVIRGNTLSKPLAWKQPGTPWQVKNLLELKNARTVTIEDNTLEHNWQAAQSGYAILFTVRNQDGGCPWCQVENVTFQRNVIRDVAAGVQILGTDDSHQSRQTDHLVIANNLFDGIDSAQWGGDGYWLQITNTPRDVTIDHNTVIQGQSGGIAKLDGRVDGLVLTNNLASHGAYGIIGTDHGVGNDTIRALLPGSVITGNVIAGGSKSAYPSGNLFPSTDEFHAQFADFSGHDFHLRPTSAWQHAAADGTALGADLAKIKAPREPDRSGRGPGRIGRGQGQRQGGTL